MACETVKFPHFKMVKQRNRDSEKRRRAVQKLLDLLDSSNESDDSNDECFGVPVVNLNVTPLNSSTGSNQGPNVHRDISDLISTVLYKGVNKDSREYALALYPLLGNCPALNPPQINPEIKANLKQDALDQDEHFRNLQSQLAAGISALAVPLDRQYERSRLDRSEVARNELANISDPIKIFSDVFHSISKHRRTLLLPLVNVGLKRRKLRALPFDDMLFGQCLAERIRNRQVKVNPPLLTMDFQPIPSNVQNNSPVNNTDAQGTSTPKLPSQCHIPNMTLNGNGNSAMNNTALNTGDPQASTSRCPQASTSGTLPPGSIKRKRTKAAKRKAQSDILQFVAVQSDTTKKQIHQQSFTQTTESTTLKIKIEKEEL